VQRWELGSSKPTSLAIRGIAPSVQSAAGLKQLKQVRRSERAVSNPAREQGTRAGAELICPPNSVSTREGPLTGAPRL
jgi:hypothetical protein